ncbi:MAG: AAA family ATPase [Thermoplasmata archaeon]|nr:AAA family ATPase [Thermoplasmata archaeon]
MTISISGPPGSGKTTVGKLLAKKLDYEFISTGMVFRQMAEEQNVSLAKFGEMAIDDHEIDKELDKRIIALARGNKSLVLEGRLAGHMLHLNGIKAFKILVDAHIHIRAERIAGREDKDVEQVRKEIETRADCEWKRYHDIYDIDRESLAVYNLVVHSDDATPEEIVANITEKWGVWND